ncbi:hypothetical protein FIBSPDRAFT_1044785 [Athelia psychrophila]|uniref:DUF6533 domain-containing protein n=1 Tax=Athelia psychrophila TaxID=1759441 RepID=A0A166J598_9AGAM|nr:hypothetical protein FIBSPDRAFT_1044785 [Fibularhizoctonia sp. CBS 109695]
MSTNLHYERIHILFYFDVASTCLLSYDYLLTFSSEMSLIWAGPRKWTVFQVLFVLSRYSPFADAVIVLYAHLGLNIDNTFCDRLHIAIGWMLTLGQMLTEVTFLMRVWAMWGGTRRIGAFLGAFFLAAWIPCIVLEGIILNAFAATTQASSSVIGCTKDIAGDVKLVRTQDAIILLYWIVLLALLVCKGGSPRKRLSGTGFYALLYRDGITYCVLLCGLGTVKMIATVFAPEFLKLLNFLQHAILSVLTNRILFRLRQYNLRTTRIEDATMLDFVPEGTLAFGRAENDNADLIELQRLRNSDDMAADSRNGSG